LVCEPEHDSDCEQASPDPCKEGRGGGVRPAARTPPVAAATGALSASGPARSNRWRWPVPASWQRMAVG